ncbi:phage tail tape measure protein, family, partial [human gut metagenome]
KKMREAGIDPTDPAYQKMQTNLNNTKAEMAKTEKQIKSTSEELKSSKVNWEAVGETVGKVGKAFGAALAALGAAAVGAASALAGLTVSASNYADDLITQATFTRQTTDDLQKYAYAARFIDVEVNTLTKSMAKKHKSQWTAPARVRRRMLTHTRSWAFP